MLKTVDKITNNNGEIVPDTKASWWQVIEELENEFIIEVLEE